jgi:hypothetical protein
MASVSVSDPFLHEHAGEFSNYDVLLAKTHLDALVLDPNQNHIGNNRFQILSNMHKDEFEERITAGEPTDVVVNKIIDIVCRQCEPKGRFMLTQGKGSWIVLTEWEARDFVTEFLLLASPSGKAKFTPPEALTNSMPVALRPADAEASASPPQELRATMVGDVNEEKKRRRRSSLLRRSVSEGNFDDKKKLGRSIVGMMFPSKPSWVPKLGKKAKPEGLDVLFNRHRTKLSAGPTGNNRLAIMIKMQQSAYLSSSDEGRQRMVGEVYSTVTEAWKGRFLAENFDKRGYTVLEDHEVFAALRCLFDPSGSAGPGPIVDPAPTPTTDELREDEASSSSDSRLPSVAKHSTMEALHQFTPEVGTSGMYNAALASLQKRKQKKDLNSKIRNLTTGTRRPGRASSTQLNRHVSAPMTTFERLESDASYSSLTPIPLPLMNSTVSLPGYGQSQSPYGYEQDLAAAIGGGGEPLQSYHDLEPDPIMEPRPLHPQYDARMSLNPIRPSMATDIDAGLIEDLLSHLDVSGDLYSQGPGGD